MKRGFIILLALVLCLSLVSAQETFNDAKGSIKLRAEQVASEINDYLIAHPEMTLEDLQNSEEFQVIAVQLVGETGYTAVTDYDSLIARFHVDPKIVNFDLHGLASKLPGFWSIMSKTEGGKEAEGSYLWEDPDGSIKQKYMYIALVDSKTANGVGLHVAATTYLDEYIIEEKISVFNFWVILGFSILILFSFFSFFILRKTKKEGLDVKVTSIRKKVVFSFFLIFLMVFLMFGFNQYLDNRIKDNIDQIRNVEAPLEFMVEQVRGYDAILTGNVHYALLHAKNGNLDEIKHHEEIYNDIGIKLDNILKKEALELLEESKRSEEEKGEAFGYLKKLDEINIVLVDLELKAFEAMNNRNIDLASSLVVSENYEEHKIELSQLYSDWEDLEKKVTQNVENDIILTSKYLEWINISLIILTLILALGMSFYVSRSFVNPLEELISTTTELSKGNFKVRTNIKSGDELEELSIAFNKTAETLQNIDKERKQLDKAKTEFLSITSHELRSPMTPMKGQLQMLAEGYFGKITPKQKQALDIVINNANHLDNIIVDFLEISRIEAARLKFDFVKTDLNKHVLSLVEEMKNFMPEKKIKFITKLNKLPVIETDPNRVMQVMRNLINNAIKFCKKNCSIKITSQLQGNMILFSVKDTGIGIPKDKQLRIFEPFYQAEQTMYRKYRGTGLGLAIVKGIVESQNGKIWVESEVGKGSTFYFTLPLEPIRKIKPIKLLFSSQENIDKSIETLFTEILGPLGKKEFEIFKSKNTLTKEKLFKYIDSLSNKSIIKKEEVILFKNKVSQSFEENKINIIQKVKDSKSDIGDLKKGGMI